MPSLTGFGLRRLGPLLMTDQSVVTTSYRASDWAWLWLPALLLPVLDLAFNIDWNIDLNDEGFLYYGGQRVLEGEMPLRDFQSYDLGRYYWVAAWLALLGDDLFVFRIANAAFAVPGLAAGMAVVLRLSRHPALLLGYALLASAWMFPNYKLYDMATSMLVLWGAVRLVERPTVGRLFQAGLVVGLAAVMGRQHGVYGGLGMAALCLTAIWTWSWRDRARGALASFGGLLLGYAPVLGPVLLAEGYAQSMAQSIGELFHRDYLLTLPPPWPWTLDPLEILSSVGVMVGAISLSHSLMLAGSPILFAAGLAVLTLGRNIEAPWRVVLLAGVAVGIPYYHYAIVRTDPHHLAFSLQPALVVAVLLVQLVWAQGPRLLAGLAAVGLALLTMSVALPNRPAASAAFYERTPYRPYVIGERKVMLTDRKAGIIDAARDVSARADADGRGLYIGPSLPMLYALLHRAAPMWEIYGLFARTSAEQTAMIEDLERNRTDWLILDNPTINKIGWPTFSEEVPILWRYFEQSFEPLDMHREALRPYRVYRRRGS